MGGKSFYNKKPHDLVMKKSGFILRNNFGELLNGAWVSIALLTSHKKTVYIYREREWENCEWKNNNRRVVKK